MTLQVSMAAQGKLDAFMAARAKGVASAVTRAVRAIAFGLQRELRRQVKKANFKSDGLEKLVRAKVLPRRGYAADAEGLIYSNAKIVRGSKVVDLIEAFDKGATITAKGGKWLAIPTEDSASKKSNPSGGFQKFRPSQLSRLRQKSEAGNRGAAKLHSSLKSIGQTELRFIPTKKPNLAMLAYASTLGGELKVAYWLVKKVTIRKRLNVDRAKQKWLPKLEPRINRNLDRYVYKTGDDI